MAGEALGAGVLLDRQRPVLAVVDEETLGGAYEVVVGAALGGDGADRVVEPGRGAVVFAG